MQLKYCIFVWTVQLLYTIYMEVAALQTIHDYYHPNEILHTLKMIQHRKQKCINDTDGDRHYALVI